MLCTFDPLKGTENNGLFFHKLYKPIGNAVPTMSPLESRGNRPLQISFEEHLKSLILIHRCDPFHALGRLPERSQEGQNTSACHLLP